MTRVVVAVIIHESTLDDTPIHSESPVIENTPCTTEAIIGSSGEWIGCLYFRASEWSLVYREIV